MSTAVYQSSVSHHNLLSDEADVLSLALHRSHVQEIDELYKIFMLLGTPNEHIWPGVSQLPDYKDTFPSWRPQPLADIVPTLDAVGLDLLSKMLVYDPQSRITARAALGHQYFQDIQHILHQQQLLIPH